MTSGPTAGDVALACCSLLADELARAGVQHVCVAPGSRSTPMALAVARHPALTVHVHLDERSAGFFALGLGKATGAPAVVVTTSGTAAANLLPAVAEAAQAPAPLILLTADRPPELRDTGANQTIDQLKLYGGFVRWFVEVGVPAPDPAAAIYWRSIAARAAAVAAHGPGPVHLNLPFREPLVPSGTEVDLGEAAGGRPDGEPWERVTPPGASPGPDAVAALLSELAASDRGVVVAGGLDREAGAVLDLAEVAAWPVVAEPTSGLRLPTRALAAAQALLENEGFRDSHTPEIVLQVGAPPTTRATQALLARAARVVLVDPLDRWPDPERRAALTVRADAGAVAASLLGRLEPRGTTEWLRSWQEADDAARGAVDSLLDSWEEPFEGRVARDLAAAAPAGSTLVVASSMPIRDLDAFMAPREGLRVLANRGVSGIDGFVSTVLGVAASGAPTYGLAGDLSLLHDVGALAWGARRGHRAVIVVLNNEGGGVFNFLPQASLPEFEELFATPPGFELGALAAAVGAGHAVVVRADELPPAVEKADVAGGVGLVEVHTERRRNVELHREVRETVARAIP